MPSNQSDATSQKPAAPHEYVVMARRYRPQSFEELVGQPQVATALRNAILTQRVGHAYLFTGARGVGKTSSARILAKALNCVQGPTPTPCNVCDICQSITAGDDVDVLEIDGASNRGIDEIRQLRSNAGVRPSRARFKIYIIDEVHMLTAPAFNALLKTLEEPPEHVKFIFCTTDPEKIPITVLSRCQRFDFAPLEANDIAKRLQEIAAAEDVELDPEALRLLARRAGGSMRDSQSLLEQLLAFSGDRISVDQVHSLLGTAPSGRLAELTSQLAAADGAGALRTVDTAVGEGVDVGQFAEQLLGYFRDLMAVAVGCQDDALLFTGASERPALEQAAEQLGLASILAAIQILDETVTRMRHSTYVRTLLETAVIRICHLEQLDQLSGMLQQLQSGASGAGSSGGRPASAARLVAPAAKPASASTSAPISETAAAEGAQKKSEQVAGAPAEREAPAEPPLTLETARLWWQQAIESLGSITADFAQHGRPTAISAPNRLVIAFPTSYTLHREHCERPERKASIEKALAQVAGRRVPLDFTTVPDTAPPPAAPVPNNPRQRKKELESHPLVKQALELFDGEIMQVDDS